MLKFRARAAAVAIKIEEGTTGEAGSSAKAAQDVIDRAQRKEESRLKIVAENKKAKKRKLQSELLALELELGSDSAPSDCDDSTNK